MTQHIGPPTEDKSDLSDLEFVQHSIDKYQNHSSVIRIRPHLDQSNKIAPFTFTEVSIETVETTLHHSNPKKATGYDQIPSRILKEGAIQLAVPITYLYNESIRQSKFSTDHKAAEVGPHHTKKLFSQ